MWNNHQCNCPFDNLSRQKDPLAHRRQSCIPWCRGKKARETEENVVRISKNGPDCQLQYYQKAADDRKWRQCIMKELTAVSQRHPLPRCYAIDRGIYVFFSKFSVVLFLNCIRYLISPQNCKVIAFCGSKDRCDWVRELGFDYVFNYNTVRVGSALKRVTSQGIDCYFDCVSGACEVL